MKQRIAAMSSDWHLATHAWSRYPAISGDSYYAIEQLFDYCKERRLPMVAAGDLLDRNSPDTFTLRKLFNFVEAMSQQELGFFYIQGDHELRYPSWLSLRDGSCHLDDVKISLGGITFYGYDYRKPGRFEAVLAEKAHRGADVVVCHQKWLEFMGGHLPSDGSLEDLMQDNQLVLTGDFHATNAYILRGGRAVLSPGSTCMQAADEAVDKYFWVLYDDFTYEKVKLKSRLFHRVRVSDQETLEQLLQMLPSLCEPQAGVPQDISKNVVHVKALDTVPDAYTYISRAVGDRAHLMFHYAVEEEDPIIICEKDRDDLVSKGLLGCLQLVCPPGTEVYDGVSRLLQSDNHDEDINEMEREKCTS